MLVPLEGVKKVLTPVPFPAYLGLKAEEGKGSQTEGFDLVPPHGLVDGAARHSSRARNERSGKGDRGLGRTKQATMPLSLHALRNRPSNVYGSPSLQTRKADPSQARDDGSLARFLPPWVAPARWDARKKHAV